MFQFPLSSPDLGSARLIAEWNPVRASLSQTLAWTAAAAVAALAVVAWRLRRRVAERTRERDLGAERFEALFDHAAVPIVEEDFTEVSRWLDGLRAQGVEDLSAYLHDHPQELPRQFTRVRPTAANRRALAMLGADDLEHFTALIQAAAAKTLPESFPLELETLWAGRSGLECETTLRIPGRPTIRARLNWQVRTRRGVPRPSRVLLTFTDLSALRTSEEHYQQLFESLPVPAWLFDAATFRFIDVNRAAVALYGWSRAEFLTLRATDIRPPEDVPALVESLATVDSEFSLLRVWRYRTKQGRMVEGEVMTRAVVVGGRRAFMSIVRDVTEARRTEAALRESEERYRKLFEQAIEGIYESSPGGRFWAVNSAFAAMLGYPDARDLLALEPPAIADLYVQPERRSEFLAQIGAGEVLRGFESEVRRRDGSTFWISENVRAVREGGRIVRVHGFVTDVTARKQAERLLREGETRFRTLFEESPVALVELDYTGVRRRLAELRARGVTDLAAEFAADPSERDRCVDLVVARQFNEAAVRGLRAQNRSQLLGRVAALLAPGGGDPLAATLSAVWRGEAWAEGESPLRCLDGGHREFHWRWRTGAVSADGAPAGAQIALVDVTTLRRTEIDLRASEQRFRLLFELSPVGIAEMDYRPTLEWLERLRGEGVTDLAAWFDTHPSELSAAVFRVPMVGANPALLRLLGAASFEAVVERDGIPLTPDVFAARRASFLAAWSGRNESEGEIDIEGLDGVVRRVYCRWRIPDVGGRPCAEHAQWIMLDMTEAKSAERSQLEAEVLRASKLEAVGVLAGGIAHDFNNLLAVIMGNLDLAQAESDLGPGVGRWLQEAEQSVHRAKSLTQQLLTFAKGGAPVRATVRLQDVVREAAEFATRGSAVSCQFDLPCDLKAADADKGQIAQVVQNLVINAVQAMPDGGSILITLRDEQVEGGRLPVPPGPYLRLSITDAGAGLPPEYLSHIFEPYFTTSKDGSGLGLATVYSIVRRHQGHVTVESEVGRGTSFHLWLPASLAPLPEPAPALSPFQGLSGRILFMDDDESLRTMADALLTRMGFEVVVTSDGRQALETFATERAAGRPFDLVMMDLTVPGGMGGAEALRGMLALDPAVRGVVSSGYSGDPVMANYRAHGFRGRVPKPYRVDELARVLREVLERP